MAVIVPNEGENLLLNILKDPGSQTGNSMYVGLFKSDTTPSASTTWASITECNFSGYTVGAASWGSVATDGGGKASMTATEVVFNHDGGGTSNDVYGWFLGYGTGNPTALIAIERFASPPAVMDDNSDSISVTPTFKLFD